MACVEAKIATGEVVHVDASLIRADVAWESLAVRHVDRVAEANGPDGAEPDDGNRPTGGSRTAGSSKGAAGGAGEEARRKPKKTGRFKKVCTTDPDASMATSGRNRRLEPSYKQHTVVDVAVTTGEVNEGDHLLDGLDRVAEPTGGTAGVVTADAGYAYAKVYAGLEAREIDTVIPAKAEQRPGKVIPTRRFKLDPRHNIARCPKGRILRPKGKPSKGFQYYHARVRDCRGCPLKARCVSPSRHARVVVFNLNHPALLRARRRRLRWSKEDNRLYQRHRWRSEGYHGEAKTWHGLARAIRRGIDNMRIQAFLTAAAVNLKRLAAALLTLLWAQIGPDPRLQAT